MIYPNCSEAVFRFHTKEPIEMQKILQLIANEIGSNSDFGPHENQIVPLFSTAKEYDTNWNKELTYSGEVRDKHEEEINKIWKQRDDGELTQEEAIERYDNIKELMKKEIYPNSLLKACAGLGDNEAVIKVNEKEGYFTLNIGNNDISQNATNWVEAIKDMNLQVEEAECDKELRDIARDCTCGIVFGFQERKDTLEE